MGELLDKIRRDLSPGQVRRGLGRRRRLASALLAGFGVLMLVTALRPAPAVPVAEQSVSVAVQPGEVAVPITIRPAAVAGALEPGMRIDVIAARDDPGHASPVTSDARVLRLPTSGFGPTSEAVVVVAVPEQDGVALASAGSTGFGVIIRPTP
ncbi:MAG TPA: hypothetical protein VGP37_04085 [Candidatus Nanopelagicales bacterium]|nr:hypothetical protein [Candidatus Nanopelagicales bacterium]